MAETVVRRIGVVCLQDNDVRTPNHQPSTLYAGRALQPSTLWLVHGQRSSEDAIVAMVTCCGRAEPGFTGCIPHALSNGRGVCKSLQRGTKIYYHHYFFLCPY